MTSNQAKTWKNVISLYIHHDPVKLAQLVFHYTNKVCGIEITNTHTQGRPFGDPRGFPHACVLSLSLVAPPGSLSPTANTTYLNPNSLQFPENSRVPVTWHLLLLLSRMFSSASQEQRLDPHQSSICRTNCSFFQ